MEHFYQNLVSLTAQTAIGTQAEALARTQSFIRNLTFAELKHLLVVDESIPPDVEQQLQYLAISAGFDAIETVSDETCLLAHPYYWAPFFLVGERLVKFTASG